MTSNSQKSDQSSTRTQHPNQPSNTAATPSNGSSVNVVQISDARRKYLATQYQYTQDQVDVIRNQICPSATDTELEFFLATCRRVKLDPFARQIYFIKRRQRVEDAWGNASWLDVGKPETSIDGLRASAEQTGDYEGQGAIEWCGEDGRWVDVWLDKEPPRAARVRIYRKGHREALVNVALFEEFCPRYNNGKAPAMWLKMPANQLAKCAEAGGLRRAFPRDLSGLYTDVEMEHTAQTYAAPDAKPTVNAAAGAAVIDVEVVETVKQLGEKQGAAFGVSALDTEIAELLKKVATASTRADLAPVGKLTSDAKGKTDERSAALIKLVQPEMEARWRTLPPAGAATKK